MRAEGAVPATIGVIGGVAKVGLDEAELELMAGADGHPQALRAGPARRRRKGGATGPPPSPPPRTSPPSPGYGSSPRVASAACTGRRARAGTSPPISRPSPGRRWPWSAPGSSPSSTFPQPSSTWRPWACPSSASARWRFPGFYLSDSGSPLDWSVESEEEAARVDPGAGLPRVSAARGSWSPTPCPEEEQLDPELHDRALRAGLEELEAPRRARQGRDALPAGPLRGGDGRREPAGQQEDHPPQRRPRRPHRGRALGLPTGGSGLESRRRTRGSSWWGTCSTTCSRRRTGTVALGTDTFAPIRAVAGGSGANAAAWLAASGVETHFVGRVGDDVFGEFLAQELRAGRREARTWRATRPGHRQGLRARGRRRGADHDHRPRRRREPRPRRPPRTSSTVDTCTCPATPSRAAAAARPPRRPCAWRASPG